jgi:hypothetical protein
MTMRDEGAERAASEEAALEAHPVQPGPSGGYAKLFLKAFDPDTGQTTSREYVIRKLVVSLGRSTAPDPERAFEAAAEGVDLGAGFSSKLSRRHATIQWNADQQRFEVVCNGKNGILVVHADTYRQLRPGDAAEPLDSYSTILLGDCLVVFVLPKATHVLPGVAAVTAGVTASPTSDRAVQRLAPSRAGLQRVGAARSSSAPLARDFQRIRVRWNKSDQEALLRGLMRFGYGRWKEILQHAESGRLDRKPLDELIIMARRMVIMAALHAVGPENRAMLRILASSGEGTRGSGSAAAASQQRELEQEVSSVAAGLSDTKTERRKYVRWARRFRLLHRIERIVQNAAVMQRIEEGDLDISGKPPADCWGPIDDADLLRGVHKLGFGDFHRLWEEPTLHFRERYRAPVTASALQVEEDTRSDAQAARTGEPFEGSEASSREAEHDEQRNLLPTVGECASPSKKSSVAASTAETPEADVSLSNNEASLTEAASLGGGSPADDLGIFAVDKSQRPESTSRDERTPFPSSVELIRRLRIVVNRVARLIEPRNKEEAQLATPAAFAPEWPGNEDAVLARDCTTSVKRLAVSRIARQQALLTPKPDALTKNDLMMDAASLEWARGRLEKAQRFNRRQVKEFERALVNYGLDYLPTERPDDPHGIVHDWLRFVRRCPFVQYMLPETLEEYYIDFVRECYRVLATDPAESPQRKSAEPAGSEDDDDHDDDHDEERTPNESAAAAPEPPSAAVVAEHSTLAPSADTVANASSSSNRYASASPEASIDPAMLERARDFPPSTLFPNLDRKRARKALVRLHLFRVLRLYVLALPAKSLADLIQSLGSVKLPQSSAGELPVWWRPVHDRALLYGIDRHGLGQGAFEQIAQDHELGFPQSIESYCAAQTFEGAQVLRMQLGFPRVHAALRRARAVMDWICAALQARPLPTETSLYDDEARDAALARAQRIGTESKWMERLLYQFLAENNVPVRLQRTAPTGQSNATSGQDAANDSAEVAAATTTKSAAIACADDQALHRLEQPASNVHADSSSEPMSGSVHSSVQHVKGRPRIFETLRILGFITRRMPGAPGQVRELTQPVDLGNGLVLLSLGTLPSPSSMALAPASSASTDDSLQLLVPCGFRSVRQLQASGHWYETQVDLASTSDAEASYLYRVRQVEFVPPPAIGSSAASVASRDWIAPVEGGFDAMSSNLNTLWIRVLNSTTETGLAAGTASFVTLVSGVERAGLADPLVQRYLQALVPTEEHADPPSSLRDDALPPQLSTTSD